MKVAYSLNLSDQNTFILASINMCYMMELCNHEGRKRLKITDSTMNTIHKFLRNSLGWRNILQLKI